ncbi:MAG: Mur ligase domain-containing protein, partial [Deltaproteobacteria bacterium]|nr:Mur ligase domain-containing protein [Deltaproteobacteria bacterium]
MIRLSELAARLGLKALGPGDPELSGLADDSREIEPGWLFVAFAGANSDGRQFLAQARARGAAATLLAEPDLPEAGPRL